MSVVFSVVLSVLYVHFFIAFVVRFLGDESISGRLIISSLMFK